MFNPEIERDKIIEWIRDWFKRNGNGCNAVIGISGGKDSTVVAALCKAALGADHVIGVMIPNGVQHDIGDSITVCKHLGIKYLKVNIKDAYDCIINDIDSCGLYVPGEDKYTDIKITNQTRTNLPPRLRMSTLYAVSQSMNGRVANTCNLSETMVGWETKWGDAVGDFAPLARYTATEVVAIGHTMDVPLHLVEKAPSDGLCGKTDEDAFGFTYRELDSYLRTGSSGSEESDEKIRIKIKNSAFKRVPTEFCPGPNTPLNYAPIQ